MVPRQLVVVVGLSTLAAVLLFGQQRVGVEQSRVATSALPAHGASSEELTRRLRTQLVQAEARAARAEARLALSSAARA